jgi:hypothetical protein
MSRYNLPDDVATVQYLLNKVPVSEGGPAAALETDGVASGPNFTATVQAILRFQQHQKGLSQDSRVDPGEETLARLNSFDSSFSPINPGDIIYPSDPPRPETPLPNPRGLLTAERDLLKDVYKDKLDYGKVQLVFNAILGTGSTRTVGNTIAVEGSTISNHTLIHEAAHVYQYQRGDHYVASALSAQAWAVLRHWDRNAAYDYSDEVANRVPFDDWNSEQQAQWIADHKRLPPSRVGESGYP